MDPPLTNLFYSSWSVSLIFGEKFSLSIYTYIDRIYWCMYIITRVFLIALCSSLDSFQVSLSAVIYLCCLNTLNFDFSYMSWASYQICKIAGCACAGNAGGVFPTRRLQREPLVSDPDMHHGTCVTHVPWCMSESLTCGGGENVPGIPGACAPAVLRIW